jgi:hypothetical protein
MCTYDTVRIAITGSAKGADSWFRATDATISYDHPVHYGAGHALLVDVINPSLGASSRVGLELNADSARELALGILRSLDSVPAGLLES